MQKKYFLFLSILLSGLQSPAQETFSFEFGGQSRNYIVYEPAAAPGQPMPVVLVLHAFTQTAQVIMQYSGFNAIAEEEGFLAVYPNGINFSWNVGFGMGGSTADDLGFLNALIDTLAGHYPLDPGRIYACGMSNGGFMSYRLACELSGRIAAIAGVAGTMTDATLGGCAPERPVPVMHIHGTADFVVPYGGSSGIAGVEESLAFWNGHNQCPGSAAYEALPDVVSEGSTVERYTWSPCEGGSEIELLKVANGGHTWPGSTGSGIGNTNRDIDASREIWNFFSRHRLAGPNGLQAPEATPFSPPYPNPFDSFILAGRPGAARILLLNGLGQLVRQGGPERHSLDTRGLPGGRYILKLVFENGESLSWAVIKI